MIDHAFPAPVRAVNVAGVPVGAFTVDSLVSRVMHMAHTDGTDVAVGVNAYVCTMARQNQHIFRLVSASTTYADGQSVVWAGRLLGSDLPERLATTDVAEPILRAAARESVPVFFLGASPGVAEAAAIQLRRRIPDLALRTHHGFFAAEEAPEVLATIREHRTGILFVGMGDPAQQMWIEAHQEDLPPAVLTCGGLFDWLSGTNRRAPAWMIRGGLEWLWRLCIEPRRLWRRYLLGNPIFIATVLRQRIRGGHG